MRTTNSATLARRVVLAGTVAGRLAAWFLLLAALGGGGFRATAQEADKNEGTSQEEAQAKEAPAPVTLVVENQNWADMRIYAVKSGTRHRLGAVTSFTRVSFELPRHLTADIGEMRFLAVPIGGSTSVLSHGIYLSAGDEVLWALQTHLALSGTVRSGG